jgi:adenine-specific DNA-methyltransferase
MQNVINGDKTGISSEVNWQGGGSFVYCELAKCNQHFVDEAIAAKSDADLMVLLKGMKTGFISSKVNPQTSPPMPRILKLCRLMTKKRLFLNCLIKICFM